MILHPIDGLGDGLGAGQGRDPGPQRLHEVGDPGPPWGAQHSAVQYAQLAIWKRIFFWGEKALHKTFQKHNACYILGRVICETMQQHLMVS